MNTRVHMDLAAVVVCNQHNQPHILLDNRAHHPALPTGPLDPEAHKTLERAIREHVFLEHGLELGYVEQLYTFADHGRVLNCPRHSRCVSTAYLALTRMRQSTPKGAEWLPWYQFLPWEDWRHGRPAILSEQLQPALEAWAETEKPDPALQQRLQLAFTAEDSQWDPERVLERYELLYQARLIPEYYLDHRKPVPALPASGRALAHDHRRMLATALGRLRGKLKYRPVVFELLEETFTLLQLQQLVESLAGHPLHKQNFRRLVEQTQLVEGTGRFRSTGRGRPAELFRFRSAVLLERPAPGLRIR